MKNNPELLSDDGLEDDARRFAQDEFDYKDSKENQEFMRKLIRAAHLARHPDIYDKVARGDEEYVNRRVPVTLSDDEKRALRNERDKLFSERNMLRVTAAICLAAFLQGLVQASLNSSSLFPELLGAKSISKTIPGNVTADSTGPSSSYLPRGESWALGGLNSVPWFAAAGLGCWLAPPVNDRFGRKGAIAISAAMIMVSCLASGLTPLIQGEERRSDRWRVLVGVRVINGIGMGIKAVSTPILASETAIRFWRGSFLLAWQLWVACGIMFGLLLNLIFAATIGNDDVVLGLMLGTPAVQAGILLIVICPMRAYDELKKIRESCELLALRDIYLLHKTLEEEHSIQQSNDNTTGKRSTGGFLDLFTQTRLRNALISASTVALSQQLCGRTLFTSFIGGDDEKAKRITALGLSFGFGAVMFFCGLPAIKTIDTLGRRKWLISTLPLMCIFMAAAAYSFPVPYKPKSGSADTVRLVATLLYRKNAARGLPKKSFADRQIQYIVQPMPQVWFHTDSCPGPIPFTLASESFPLSHREIGCASVISVNLFFAGVITIFFPRISEDSFLTPPGSLGLFSGLTLLTWVLVYFLVEETRQLSLEDLYSVFSQRKVDFVKKMYKQLGYLVQRYLFRNMDAKDPFAAPDGEEDEGEYAPPQYGMPMRPVSSGGATVRSRWDSAAASPRGSVESHPRNVPSERQ
ncbi:sugar transporter [Apiospora saccharicola]|uniref:Sugar transporter n=1 Tax=Apiospora saccharicola TaxID=335842 RepID=A0ABR1ULY3_9PEZI